MKPNNIVGNVFETTHGMSGTRPYRIWYDMKRRCDNPNVANYKNYGALGIKYSKDWETFEGFWLDMEKGYSDNLTLERLDSNKDYCKENCCWATYREQSQNKNGYRSNSLNIPNMTVLKTKGFTYLRVRITNPETKQRPYKSFNLDKIPYEDALTLAYRWLEEKKKEYGYSEFHGRTYGAE